MSTVNESLFLREPLHRPSHTSKLDSLSPEQAYERFLAEQRILQAQLKECEEFYKYLLDLRSKKKSGQKVFDHQTELAEGFFVKTELNDPEVFIVSLGLQDAYVELELGEAVAYAQQREQYLRVALAKLADRLSGLQAELRMDYEQLAEILKNVQQNIGGSNPA